jgi:hypothetical protein
MRDLSASTGASFFTCTFSSAKWHTWLNHSPVLGWQREAGMTGHFALGCGQAIFVGADQWPVEKAKAVGL